MFRLAITCSAAAAALVLTVGGARPSLAQQEQMFGVVGSGPQRVCSVLVDTNDAPVWQTGNPDNAVYTLGTYDCPEAMCSRWPRSRPRRRRRRCPRKA